MTIAAFPGADAWGWPVGMPRVTRLAVTASMWPDSAVWVLLQRVYDLRESTVREELITGLSVRLIQSGCRLEDGRKVRWIEIDWGSDGMGLVQILDSTGVEVDPDVVDGNVETWVSNVRNPALVMPGADPDYGPYTVDLEGFCSLGMAEYWGPRGDLGSPPDDSVWWLADSLTRTLFLGEARTLPTASQWADAEAIVGRTVDRVDEVDSKPLKLRPLWGPVRRALREPAPESDQGGR
ncbi:hypothetical protein OG563_26650 [Nocardia vinacea]|uniref:Aminoglycoside phosphotransferase n=1 Tax=Nocardia vinacea TaxID=96468 RepID=A0ABZ1YIN5_9NOCA|nr:hypothetical protein [Nocardia vinacea]